MKPPYSPRDNSAYEAPRLPRETIPNTAEESNRPESNLESSKIGSSTIGSSSREASRIENSTIRKAEDVALQTAPDNRSAALWLPLCLIAVLGLVSLGAWTNRRSAQPPIIGPITNRVLEEKPVVVHVAGAVKKPGVYTLKSGARLHDALQKAGGATAQADADALNLAAFAQDGTKIEVPLKPQTAPRIATLPDTAQTALNTEIATDQNLKAETASASTFNDSPITSTTPNAVADAPLADASLADVPFASAQAAARKPTQRAASAATSSTRSEKTAASSREKPRKSRPQKSRVKKEKSKTIAGLPRALTPSGELSDNASPQFLAKHPLDLNRITAEQLEALPGVGPSLAARILAYRKANGGFKSVDELDNVKGIGEKKLADLRPLLRIEGEVQNDSVVTPAHNP